MQEQAGGGKRRQSRWVAGALAVSCAAMLAQGCETGRTNKAHASWQHLSDATTTSKPPQAGYSSGDHQPPVPGSPTAAGADGNQPLDDAEARARHGNEHGEAAAPHAQPADSPEKR